MPLRGHTILSTIKTNNHRLPSHSSLIKNKSISKTALCYVKVYNEYKFICFFSSHSRYSGGDGEGLLNYGIVVLSDHDGMTLPPPAIVLDTDGNEPIRTDHVTVWTAPTRKLWIIWCQYPKELWRASLVFVGNLLRQPGREHPAVVVSLQDSG